MKIYLLLFGSRWIHQIHAFSSPSSIPPSSPRPPLPPSSEEEDGEISSSRRNFLYWPIGVGGAVVYGKLVSDAVGRLSRGDLVYPEAHERAISKVISQSLYSSASYLQSSWKGMQQASSSPSSPSSSSSSPSSPSSVFSSKPLRILEVGIGGNCRVIRRGLYSEALERIATLGISKVDILGIDLGSNLPSEDTLQKTREHLQHTASQYNLQTTLTVRQQSITKPFTVAGDDETPGVGSTFDVVLCFLTLCSVDDPDVAIQQIHSLTRPDGGVFGYVEHVAVRDTSQQEQVSYRFLDWQQRTLDPLQQVVADNCHLHRHTDDNIAEAFHVGSTSPTVSQVISQETFLVEDMWPVSYQASGVIQRII